MFCRSIPAVGMKPGHKPPTQESSNGVLDEDEVDSTHKVRIVLIYVPIPF
jgi:hypothetical protein